MQQQEVTLSSLSGEELLSILRQSLSKKKPQPTVTVVEKEIIKPSNGEVEDGLVYESNAGTLANSDQESNKEDSYQTVTFQTQQDLPNIDSVDECQETQSELFSPDEFLRDVLSTDHKKDSELNVKDPLYLGKLSAHLYWTASFNSLLENFSKRLEGVQLLVDEKKAFWMESKEKYKALKDQLENSLKEIETAALEYKEVEQDKRVLESLVDWITRVKGKSSSKCDGAARALDQFGKNLSTTCKDLVSPLVLEFLSSFSNQGGDFTKLVEFSDSEVNTIPMAKKAQVEKKVPLSNRLGQVRKDLSYQHRSIESICAGFNRDSCSYKNGSCKYIHLCLHCGGSHPVTHCGPSKATERILCVQWNVDEKKCRDQKCPREHRCIRCCSIGHQVVRCNAPGTSKSAARTYCYLWNASSVNYCHTRDCKRIHGCLRCGSKSHGALNCPDNVETYYIDASAINPPKRRRSLEVDPRRDVRGRLDV